MQPRMWEGIKNRKGWNEIRNRFPIALSYHLLERNEVNNFLNLQTRVGKDSLFKNTLIMLLSYIYDSLTFKIKACEDCLDDLYTPFKKSSANLFIFLCNIF